MNAIITGEHLTEIDKHFLIVEPMENTKEWEDWDSKCMEIDYECSKFNNTQEWNEYHIERANQLLTSLISLGYQGSEVDNWIKTLPKPEPLKNSEDYYPKEPK